MNFPNISDTSYYASMLSLISSYIFKKTGNISPLITLTSTNPFFIISVAPINI